MNKNINSCVSFERDSILRTDDELYFNFSIANQNLLSHLDIELKGEVDLISLIVIYSLKTSTIDSSKVEVIYCDNSSEVYDVEFTEFEYDMVYKHINEILIQEYKKDSNGVLFDYEPLYTDEISEMVHISDLINLIKLGRANRIQTNYLESILKSCIRRNETVTEIFNKDTCSAKGRLYVYGVVCEYCLTEINLDRIINCNTEHKINPYLFVGSLTEYIYCELCKKSDFEFNSRKYEELLNFISLSFEKYIGLCTNYRLSEDFD